MYLCPNCKLHIASWEEFSSKHRFAKGFIDVGKEALCYDCKASAKVKPFTDSTTSNQKQVGFGAGGNTADKTSRKRKIEEAAARLSDQFTIETGTQMRRCVMHIKFKLRYQETSVKNFVEKFSQTISPKIRITLDRDKHYKRSLWFS